MYDRDIKKIFKTRDLRPGAITALFTSGDFDFSGSSGTFKTSTGAITIGPGAVGITGTTTVGTNGTNKNLTVNGNLTVTGTATITGGSIVNNTIGATLTWDTGFGILTNAGIGAFDFSNGTGIFKTSSGTNTLSGNVVIAKGKTLSVDATGGAGAGTYDFSNSTGAFTTSTGTVTSKGNLVVDGTKTFTTGTGAVTVKGDVTLDAGKNISMTDGVGTFTVGTGGITASSGNLILNTAVATAYGIALSSTAKVTQVAGYTDYQAAVDFGKGYAGVGTWTASIASEMLILTRTPATETSTYYIPIPLPGRTTTIKGGAISSIVIRYHTDGGHTGADDILFTLIKTLGQANGTISTSSAVTTSYDANHDSAAKRWAHGSVQYHTLTLTITTPEYQADGGQYFLKCATVDSDSGLAFVLRGVSVNYTCIPM